MPCMGGGGEKGRGGREGYRSDEEKETKDHMGKGEGVSIQVGCGHVDETMEDPSLVGGLCFHIHLYSVVFSKLMSLFSSPN